MKKAIHSILVFFKLDFLLLFLPNKGYLYEKAWFTSFLKKKPLDRNNQPIPWLTYGMIEFLDERLTKDMVVFEFGSGGSTSWFAKRVNKVYSVENDQNWYKSISLTLPSNVEYFFESIPPMSYKDAVYPAIGHGFDNYTNIIDTLPIEFDLIIVDGVDRLNSIVKAIEKVSKQGVILVDNFEYEEEMKTAIALLYQNNFRILKFSGLAPGITWTVKTVIFYKDNNCFGI